MATMIAEIAQLKNQNVRLIISMVYFSHKEAQRHKSNLEVRRCCFLFCNSGFLLRFWSCFLPLLLTCAFLRLLFSLTKDRGANPHHRRSFFDSNFEIVSHAHRQFTAAIAEGAAGSDVVA